MENKNQSSKLIETTEHEDVSKMNIIHAYMLGWITFGEALERMKKLNQEDNIIEFKKAH